jgi:VWFA-related protein
MNRPNQARIAAVKRQLQVFCFLHGRPTIRTPVLLLTFVGFALPAFGAKRVTVAQLEQVLSAAHNLPDAEVARQLSDLELTERLSTANLDHLETDMPGEKSRQALMILADASAFLDPPAAEIPDQRAPDPATQRKILALTVNYVTQTIHQLPNFFAARVTRSFEDTPAVQMEIGAGDINPNAGYRPIHLVGDSKATVSFRDGHEVLEKTKLDPLVRNLDTAGVFGPILATVLVDAARSKLAWSHWEQGPTGLQAVFSYQVPKEKSHYTITYDSVPTDPANTTPQTFSKVVAYHGEMAVDSASGTILRLMLLADLKPDEFAPSTSDIEVEYGQVIIGGKTYFLPVRSVSSSLGHYLFISGAGGNHSFPTVAVTRGFQTSLNDVVFEDYHVFRADATVLPEREAEKLESQPSIGSKETSTKEAESTNRAVSATTPMPAATDTLTAKAESAIPATQPAAYASALPTPLESQAATSTAKQEAAVTETPIFKTTARDVVVDVVVTKGNGDPALGLSKQDFQVKEDGKPQAIDFFEEHTASSQQPGAPPAMPAMPPGVRTNVPPAPESDAVNVLLLDTLNTEQQDQAYVHQQIMGFLTKMQPGTRVAIFMLGSKLRFVQGFTADTSVLLAALNDKRNGMKSEKDSSFRSRSDNDDDAADIANLRVMQASGYGIEALQAAQADSRAHDYGTRASMTFEALNYLGHYLAGIPGRKNLIWFASSFPVIIFPAVEQRDRIKQNPNLPGYLDQVRTTADLFTLSKIAVYPIGAAGMMTEHIAEANAAGPGAAGGVGHTGSQADTVMSPYSASAGERANTTYAMEQLAASTGGKAYYNTNDLNGAMQRAINDGAHYYTIGYSPIDRKMDGSYRQIDVKLAKDKYKLAYRHGYNADDTPVLEAKSGTDPLGALLVFGMPGASGVLYGVRAAPVTPQPAPDATHAGENLGLKSPLTRYGVDFIVRAQDVGLQPNPQGGRSGKILIGLKAFDRDGSRINWEGNMEKLDMNADDYEALQKTGIPAHLEIDLPSNMDFHLVTAVYDWNTGKAGTLEIPLHPAMIAATPAVH